MEGPETNVPCMTEKWSENQDKQRAMKKNAEMKLEEQQGAEWLIQDCVGAGDDDVFDVMRDGGW